jgi:hypothetical protein
MSVCPLGSPQWFSKLGDVTIHSADRFAVEPLAKGILLQLQNGM